MKALIGTGIGVLALGGILFANAGRSNPAQGAAPTAVTTQPQSRPTLVNCGEGRQAVIYNDSENAGVSRVECVDAPPMAPVQVGYGLPMASQFNAPSIVGPTAPARPVERVVYRDRVATPPVARSQGTYRSAAPAVDRPTQVRSWKKSALIIGGSTAAGAGVGAVLDGKSGAKKGAVVGLIGATIYDVATRTKH